ncbi:L-2-hydroxyglutarate oxidase [Acidimangrovimonas sediminis]|uniref:L-2-hydroxyglutarate oxidase n=1 Tax=Acidimangrovimonas sediminis TaxID=2056283 RepID=UPI000C7FB17C|nr:L-2-hydroxyglutarate oxidase [Acidimangrovimonas sediminis]
MAETFDFVVVGAGIVGIATARRLQTTQPGARVAVIEKEEAVALHQSGRNSGVIHAGVYYAPGSAKARFCRLGVAATRTYCDENGLNYETCGKLIVATDEAEEGRLQALHERAVQNGIRIEPVTGAEARRMEPNISAVAALYSPTTGITDFAAIARHMAHRFTAEGGSLRTGEAVTGGRETAQGVTLTTSRGEIQAGKAVFCAGLGSDRMAQAFGAEIDFRVIPFRGEYYRIVNQPEDLVRHLIYPVPNPARPFLGVHLTRKMDGGFTVGPNAVLAGAREGYGKLDMNTRDLRESLSYPGFWRLVGRNFAPAMGELAASASKRLYLTRVQRYCARITLNDLAPYKPGIRAQAVSRDGRLIDDFLFVDTEHTLHVCNAPSPAATSSIPIAAHIVARLTGGTAGTEAP